MFATTKLLDLTLLHSKRPKLHGVLAVLSAKGLRCAFYSEKIAVCSKHTVEWGLRIIERKQQFVLIAAQFVPSFELPTLDYYSIPLKEI